MKYPNFNEEKKLWKAGYKCVVGLDEAGRGPLAGPVVAAAVMINPKHEIRNSKQYQNSKFQHSKHILNLGIRDSKQLSEKQRDELYKILTNYPQIKWGAGVVSEKVIDKINILEATKLAMLKSLASLQKKLNKPAFLKINDRQLLGKIDFILIDGNFTLRQAQGKQIPQKSIIGGDAKVFSISAASIIAKVTRDRLMKKYHKKYPAYGFNQHKGYPTKAHFASLQKFGPCKIHRKSFYPVSNLPQNLSTA